MRARAGLLVVMGVVAVGAAAHAAEPGAARPGPSWRGAVWPEQWRKIPRSAALDVPRPITRDEEVAAGHAQGDDRARAREQSAHRRAAPRARPGRDRRAGNTSGVRPNARRRAALLALGHAEREPALRHRDQRRRRSHRERAPLEALSLLHAARGRLRATSGSTTTHASSSCGRSTRAPSRSAWCSRCCATSGGTSPTWSCAWPNAMPTPRSTSTRPSSPTSSRP